MATEQNETIRRGGSYELAVSVTDEDGAALDLSGFTLTYEVAPREGDAAKFTVANADITLSDDAGTNDKATVPLTSANTKTLTGRSNWHHELYLEDASSERNTLMYGTLEVEVSQLENL